MGDEQNPARIKLSAKNVLGRRFLMVNGTLTFRVEIERIADEEWRCTTVWLNAPKDPKPKRTQRRSLWGTYIGAYQSGHAQIRDWVCWITDQRPGQFHIAIDVRRVDRRAAYQPANDPGE